MLDFNAVPLGRLADELLGSEEARQLLRLAVLEDTREIGDVTSASIIEPGHAASGLLVARQTGVVAGLAVVEAYLEGVGLKGAMQSLHSDGQPCEAGQAIGRIECALTDILLHERPILNFLGCLSGIATLTRRYVRAVAGTSAVICDTRKTTPGMRMMEKYAVRCGGGTLHRFGLYDAALYKDNHIAHIPLDELTTSLAHAARAVRQRHDLRFVEVEVDSLEQFRQVLAIEQGLIDLVLLDNMTIDQLREAVAMRAETAPGMLLEASGGVGLDSVGAIAQTGVDRIAVGALTHSAHWLDIGLDIEATA